MAIVTILEHMGVGGIKLGQFASTRYDLLPATWIAKLSRLREHNHSVKLFFNEEPFLFVEKEPIATASIGQVYRATLKTGEEVAIKVKKPGVDQQIKRMTIALKALLFLPSYVNKRCRDLRGLVQEFERTLQDETNYLIEASNMDRIRQFSSVEIPKVYWDYTTKDQLVTAFVEGETLSTKHRDKADELVHALMEQLLIHGIFHADLHPGNLKVKPDGTLVMLDFGMVGRISGSLQENLMLLAYGFLIDNEQLVMESMLQLCICEQVNKTSLLHEVRRSMDLYISTPLSKVHFQSALFELIGLLRKHKVFVRPEMIYVIKALVTTEGVAVGINGNISIYGMMEPFKKQLMQEVVTKKCKAILIHEIFKHNGYSS